MLLQLAQRGGADPLPGLAGGGVCCCFYGGLFIGGGVLVVFQILTLVSMSRALDLVAPRNREMEPGQVWLNLVPGLSLVWIFLSTARTADSLQNEFEDRGLRPRSEDGDYSRGMGLYWAISLIVCGLVAPVFMILYRNQLKRLTEDLEDAPRRKRRPRRDDDDYGDEDPRDDDRPRRRRDED